ncbi:MAG TPA: HEAT repeat domain-containing protein, partial [Ktedonobacteraceae bacterium]|nr:HEAT repeat domain-containing protein [Ktedonobacteraceae bacterium]
MSPSKREQRLQQLQSPNGQLRRYAALALGASGEAQVIVPLVAALRQETKDWVRSALVEALKRLGEPQTVDLLV